jgi:hypothetical protein
MAFPTAIEHVFVIYGENHSYDQVLAQGPYLRSLYDTYGSLPLLYAKTHPSIGNYLYGSNGRVLTNNDGASGIFGVKNLFQLAIEAGLSAVNYAESIPKPCYTGGNIGEYIKHHVPALYYSWVRAHDCPGIVLPLTSFDDSQPWPNFAWITPNAFDCGHTPSSVPNFDSWLKGWLEPLLGNDQADASAFLVLYDESLETDTTGGAVGCHGGHIFGTVVSPLSKGLTYGSATNQAAMLATIEYLLGIPIGACGADDRKYAPWLSCFGK